MLVTRGCTPRRRTIFSTSKESEKYPNPKLTEDILEDKSGKAAQEFIGKTIQNQMQKEMDKDIEAEKRENAAAQLATNEAGVVDLNKL